MLVYQCDCCRTHTVFDTHSFDDPKGASSLTEVVHSPVKRTNVDMVGTVKAAAAQNKKLQQFLAKKRQKQPANEPADDLSSFLRGLSK